MHVLPRTSVHSSLLPWHGAAIRDLHNELSQILVSKNKVDQKAVRRYLAVDLSHHVPLL